MRDTSIKTDFDQIIQSLDDIGKKQVPYATSLALNGVIKIAKDEVAREMPSAFDRADSLFRGRPAG